MHTTAQAADRLYFAKTAHIIVNAPGLFRSPEKGDRDRYIRIKHNLDKLEFEIAGPVLSSAELRVLRAAAALAGPAFSGQPAPEGQSKLDRLESLLTRSLPLRTSYTELARLAGYSTGSSARAAVRNALKRLAGVTMSVTEGARGLVLGHLISLASGRENDCLTIGLCPAVMMAVLGGRGDYVRVSLDEANALKTDPARLLHHRLHWLQPGLPHSVNLDTMLPYVYPECADSASTLRTRRATLRRALKELGDAGIGWTVSHVGDKYTIGRPASRSDRGRPPGRIADALPAGSRTPPGRIADANSCR